MIWPGDVSRRLSAGHRVWAVISTETPADIITQWDRRVTPDVPDGAPASEMTEEKRELLMKLVMEYTSSISEDVADYRLNRLRMEVER